MVSRITTFINRQKQSDFVGNAAVMITGTGIAQMIPILVIPVLTRLYTPDEIGLLATFISLFTIFSTIAAGQYEPAIIMPESESEGKRLLHIATILSVFSGILLWFVVIIFGDSVSRAMGVPAIAPFMWLIPICVTAQGLFMSFSFGLNRGKEYRNIALGKVNQTGSTAIIQILGGLAGWGLIGLIAAKVVGVALSAVYLGIALYRKIPNMFTGERFSEIRHTAREYSNYPKYRAPHALTGSVSGNMPVILFVSFFTETIAGYYAMAFRATYAPVQIVSAALGQVFGKRLADKKHTGENVRSFVSSSILNLAAMGIIPFALLFIAGPTVFGFILGSEWAVTGDYVRVLIPFVYLTFISQPLSYIPLVYERQKKAFIIFLFSSVLRMLGIFMGIWLSSFYISLLLYSATGVAVLLYQLYWYLSLCDTGSDGLKPVRQ